jgi:hypothetical protein
MREFIAIAALFVSTVGADAASWVRSDVYFRGWLSERYAAISPEGLRDEARHGLSRAAHITSPSQLQQLLAVLDLSRLRPVRADSRSDTYLVIDLFDAAGARTTYRCDSFHLSTADCSRGRAVDAHFRKFFEQFTPRPNHAMERTADRCTLHF